MTWRRSKEIGKHMFVVSIFHAGYLRTTYFMVIYIDPDDKHEGDIIEGYVATVNPLIGIFYHVWFVVAA